jgi:hypothetical protein
MAAAYWTLQTEAGKTVTVSIEALNRTASVNRAPIHRGLGHGLGRVAVVNDGIKNVSVSESQEFVSGNVNVRWVSDRKLTVSNGQWETSATIQAFPFSSLNKGKVLLDVALKPLYNVESDVVAPHGIIGQSYDGDQIALDGARDVAQAGEMTTKAQGEGALEGTIADYQMKTPFGTDFVFSRFDKLAAKPRDVSKLTGRKRAKVPSMASVGAVPAPLPAPVPVPVPVPASARPRASMASVGADLNRNLNLPALSMASVGAVSAPADMAEAEAEA